MSRPRRLNSPVHVQGASDNFASEAQSGQTNVLVDSLFRKKKFFSSEWSQSKGLPI